MFQSTLFSVILVRMFLRFIFFVIVVYDTALRYQNVNKNIPRLFQSLSRVFKLKTKYKLYALRIHQCKGSGWNVVKMNATKASIEQLKIPSHFQTDV